MFHDSLLIFFLLPLIIFVPFSRFLGHESGSIPGWHILSFCQSHPPDYLILKLGSCECYNLIFLSGDVLATLPLLHVSVHVGVALFNLYSKSCGLKL